MEKGHFYYCCNGCCCIYLLLVHTIDSVFSTSITDIFFIFMLIIEKLYYLKIANKFVLTFMVILFYGIKLDYVINIMF